MENIASVLPWAEAKFISQLVKARLNFVIDLYDLER